MSHYEPKPDPRWAGLGKVIVFTALVAGLLSGLFTLLIGILAPSYPHQYWIGLSAFIGVTLAFVLAWKRWPAQTHRLLTMKRFRGW